MGKAKPKYWPEGVPASIKYPEITLPDMLRKTAENHPTATAIIFKGNKISYQELDEHVSRFASALQDMGVKKGDVVGLMLPNMPQFVIGYYGAMRAGAIVTAISPLFQEREAAFQISNSGAKTIVVLDLFESVIKNVKEETKLKNIIVAKFADYLSTGKRIFGRLLGKIPGKKVEKEEGIHFFKELIGKYPPEPKKVKIDPKEDLAILQYTGGTTGTPKGTMLTHFNLVSNAIACTRWLAGSKEGEETFLTALPLFHIFGMTTSMNDAVAMAGTMVLVPKFSVADVLEEIEKNKVTIWCGVPTMYAILVARPETTKFDLSSIKFCLSGAGALPPEVQRGFMKLTGGALVEGYGLTEASPVTHCNPLDRTLKTVKIGSIGLSFPDTEAKIMDAETGTKELPPGEVGELVVKGPQVMKGYWKLPEETKRALRKGWLYTGDLGKMDEDGYFYIVERAKDLIKYKGYSVFPRELEDIAYEHPAVKLCAVIGKPDPVAGEIPKAFCVLKEGATATEKEIMDFVNKKIAKHKHIRELEFRDAIPQTLVGKVLRRELRDEEVKKATESI
ncbi:MAG: long-chain fatty acid--CoA ligase [Candidatus Hodarchaeota archaeon]